MEKGVRPRALSINRTSVISRCPRNQACAVSSKVPGSERRSQIGVQRALTSRTLILPTACRDIDISFAPMTKFLPDCCTDKRTDEGETISTSVVDSSSLLFPNSFRKLHLRDLMRAQRESSKLCKRQSFSCCSSKRNGSVISTTGSRTRVSRGSSSASPLVTMNIAMQPRISVGESFLPFARNSRNSVAHIAWWQEFSALRARDYRDNWPQVFHGWLYQYCCEASRLFQPRSPIPTFLY
jgi:hypothetical protein